MHAQLLLLTQGHMPYPNEHFSKTEPVDIQIDKVTIGALLTMGMSPSTKSKVSLNPRIYQGNLSTCVKSRS
jgi:hypothetical protein